MCRKYPIIYIKTINSIFCYNKLASWISCMLHYTGRILWYSKSRMSNKKNSKERIQRNLVKDVISLHINSFLRIYITLVILAQHCKKQHCATVWRQWCCVTSEGVNHVANRADNREGKCTHFIYQGKFFKFSEVGYIESNVTVNSRQYRFHNTYCYFLMYP